MERLRTIIATSSDVITGKTTLIAKFLIAGTALTVGLTGSQIPNAKEAPEIQPLPVIPYEASWKCEDCTPNEQYVLAQLQEHTRITDRNALATIMGNIKQESKFIPNICEGGARISYESCHSGGYGLIQWTSINRYNNLGKFCEKYSCDPSSLEGQTRFMINETIFQRYLPMFEGNGQTVRQYMVPAYYWLGWGIKGNRELYAYDYHKKLKLA
tara:strand:+ start:81 stop:719 length:639 start_codon:yes stop_codon:yes gene_type:complete